MAKSLSFLSVENTSGRKAATPLSQSANTQQTFDFAARSKV